MRRGLSLLQLGFGCGVLISHEKGGSYLPLSLCSAIQLYSIQPSNHPVPFGYLNPKSLMSLCAVVFLTRSSQTIGVWLSDV